MRGVPACERTPRLAGDPCFNQGPKAGSRSHSCRLRADSSFSGKRLCSLTRWHLREDGRMCLIAEDPEPVERSTSGEADLLREKQHHQDVLKVKVPREGESRDVRVVDEGGGGLPPKPEEKAFLTHGRPPRDRGDLNRCTIATEEVRAVIHDMFEYHAWDAYKQECGGRVREALEKAAIVIVANVPPGPDRTTAIRKLREARMDANSAITHAGKY